MAVFISGESLLGSKGLSRADADLGETRHKFRLGRVRRAELQNEVEDVEELRRAPRLAFSEAVSAGDWTLTDPEGMSHVIDGPVRMAANNTQMLLAAARAGAGVAYGPTFVFGERIATGDLIALLPDHRTSDLAIHALYPSIASPNGLPSSSPVQ